MSSNPDVDLRISVLQHYPTPADIEAGLRRLEQAASDAAAQGSSLLISPECGVTGYDMSLQDAQSSAFATDSQAALRIEQIARRHGIAILYGFMEQLGDQRFNSVRLLDEAGDTLLHYRKTHLWGDLDKQLFSAGNQLAPVVTYRGWRLSTLICYDVEFPEAVRALALAGAQLVLVPTALMTPFRFVPEHMVPVRAAENQIYLAYANLVGRERNTVYEGRSTIADPQGNVLARASSNNEALVHTALSAGTLGTIRRELPYHQDRRPELYGSLAQAPDSQNKVQ